MINRRHMLATAWGALALSQARVSFAAATTMTSEDVLQNWYRLVLMLVRHTPTYSPPVASRAFAYLGIAAHEAVVAGDGNAMTLAGQIKGLDVLPNADTAMHLPHLMHGALEQAVTLFFGSTGPTGQRSIKAMSRKISASLMGSVDDAIAAASEDRGRAIAGHVFQWSKTDGGHDVQNLGFPLAYAKPTAPHGWVPTNPSTLQQTPLLPDWGNNRTFAIADGKACTPPPPPAYSEDTSSAFYRAALEVADVTKALTPEQKTIARFWSDDPMLSPTPPGHWISIALQIFERDKVNVQKRAEVLARLGMAVADAFVGCWATKFEYDLLRPITYIRRVIDPKWTALLITPPFPEYPSGHSTQSGAAEVVLAAAFGENFAFEDATHIRDGLKPRTFASFKQAAEESAISRMFGGIHFRFGVERGLDQGRCIGTHALKLKMSS